MKTNTILFECDVCARKRIDGDLIPEDWRESKDFGLCCPDCWKGIISAIDRMRSTRQSLAVDLATGNIERDGNEA